MTLYQRVFAMKECLQGDLKSSQDPKLRAYVRGRLDQVNMILPEISEDVRRSRYLRRLDKEITG